MVFDNMNNSVNIVGVKPLLATSLSMLCWPVSVSVYVPLHCTDTQLSSLLLPSALCVFLGDRPGRSERGRQCVGVHAVPPLSSSSPVIILILNWPRRTLRGQTQEWGECKRMIVGLSYYSVFPLLY